MIETVIVWAIAVVVVIGVLAAVVELRRIGDLLEAVNHALERIAVELKRTR